jgi:hypothetical protein
MTEYSVAHAPKGISFLVVTDTKTGKPVITRLKNDPAAPAKSKEKQAFLEGIVEGDRVFLELGGPADRLALAAYAHGAEVHRYPSFLLNKEKTTAVLDEYGLVCKDEKATSTETSEVLTSRKRRALALFALAGQSVDSFYELSDKDLSLMRLAIAWRSYERSYKGTQRAYLGILAAYRDQAFVELALKRQMKADASSDAVHNRVLELMLEDMLGGQVNETERKDFFSMIGKEFEGGQLPKRATEETIAVIVNALLESDSFRSTVFDRLKGQKKAIEKLLTGTKKKGDPQPANEIYAKVFEPIQGCGPLIAARLITAIGDIRRFETFPKLKSFAGYHHFEDGSRARRKAGTVSNWSPTLKQGVYLFCDITVKQKSDSPWRRKLDQRKAFELYKLMYDRQLKAMELNIDVEILPARYSNRVIKSVLDVTVADFIALAAHLEQVQKNAGVAWKGDEADDGAEDEEEVDETDAKSKRDPRLGKLVKGLKGQAHQKGLRWLGQQFLKHVYRTWYETVEGVAPGFPIRTSPVPVPDSSEVIRKGDAFLQADAAAE